MKSIIIFSLINLLCLNIYCQQKGEKFNYELNPSGSSYTIMLKAAKPIAKDAIQVRWNCLDEQWLRDTYFSIIDKSISPEKMQKLIGRGGFIDIRFSSTGKVLRVRMSISKENLEILNENDLYTLYCNLFKCDMDMSKIELEYPIWLNEGTEVFFGFSLQIKRKQK